MTKRKVIIAAETAIIVLLAVLLISSAILLYFDGIALKAEDPMADIYTALAIKEKVLFIVPVLIGAVILCIAAASMRIKGMYSGRNIPDIEVGDNASRSINDGKAARIRLLVFGIAVICIIAGFFNGSLWDVFVKASRICTECIGLG